MEDPKWKRFEKLVYEIQKDLAGDAEVKLSDSLRGLDSKANRQIDISIKKRVGQYPILIVIDCKDYKEPVDVKDIEAFSGLVRDVRANRGAVVASNGFTDTAVRLARNQGIDTFRLVDTESVDWKRYVAIPVLLKRTYLQRFSLQFVATGHVVLPASSDALVELQMCTEDGVLLGTCRQVLQRKWDRHEIPRQAGSYDVVLGDNVVIEFQGTRSHVTVSAAALVATEFYFGPLPVNVRGLEDVQDGGIIARSLRTARIEPFRIEQGLEKDWKKVEHPEQLSVLKPFFTLSYCDVYGEEPVPAKPV
jgi:hypothetical protein